LKKIQGKKKEKIKQKEAANAELDAKAAQQLKGVAKDPAQDTSLLKQFTQDEGGDEDLIFN